MTHNPQFDVFLCYNSEDKTFVTEIADRLRKLRFSPWLDHEQLQGGDLLSDVMHTVTPGLKAAVVFIGGNGLGPWQKEEIDVFVRESVERKLQVITVLFDSAEDKDVPWFLKNRIWIDYRRLKLDLFGRPKSDPFERLVIAIRETRIRPQNSPPPEEMKRFGFEVVTIKIEMGGFLGLQKQVVRTSDYAEAEYFRQDLGRGVILNMVAIPGGTFLMGSPDSEERKGEFLTLERPQHPVTIAPFYMSKFAVTQAQYQAIMGNNPAKFNGDNRPVEFVSWEDAITFCQKLSEKTGRLYRLPSEAEWEYACRARTTTPFHFGETITSDLVNFRGNSTYGSAPVGIDREETTEVGTFPPNSFGLYDMHGNVLEWCEDHSHRSYEEKDSDAPKDGRAWVYPIYFDENLTSIENFFNAFEDGFRCRILRGGAWDADSGKCRSASRTNNRRDNCSYNVGFRVACSPDRAL